MFPAPPVAQWTIAGCIPKLCLQTHRSFHSLSAKLHYHFLSLLFNMFSPTRTLYHDKIDPLWWSQQGQTWNTGSSQPQRIMFGVNRFNETGSTMSRINCFLNSTTFYYLSLWNQMRHTTLNNTMLRCTVNLNPTVVSMGSNALPRRLNNTIHWSFHGINCTTPCKQ